MRTVVPILAVALAACGGDDGDVELQPACMLGTDPHDEDGDSFVDKCDNCPADANPGQEDTTEVAMRAFADDVGDACDPRGGVAGDVLRGFYSFASADDANAWTGTGFTVSGDAAHASGAAAWTSKTALQGDGYLVRADIASLDVDGRDGVSITLDGDGQSTGATCLLQVGELTASEVSGTAATAALTKPIAPDQAVTLIAWRTIALIGGKRVAQVTCRVLQGTDSKQAVVMLTDDAVTGKHVIALTDGSADISSVSVYTSPGPKNP